VTRGAGPVDKSLCFRIGKKCRDLRRDVGSRKWFRIRTELADHPVEKQRQVLFRNRSVPDFMFGLDQLLPSGAVEGIERVIIDTVARRTVLPDDFSHRSLRHQDFRPCRPSLRSRGCGQPRPRHRQQHGNGESQFHPISLRQAREEVLNFDRCCPAGYRTNAARSEACSRSSAYRPGTQHDGFP